MNNLWKAHKFVLLMFTSAYISVRTFGDISITRREAGTPFIEMILFDWGCPRRYVVCIFTHQVCSYVELDKTCKSSSILIGLWKKDNNSHLANQMRDTQDTQDISRRNLKWINATNLHQLHGLEQLKNLNQVFAFESSSWNVKNWKK